MALSYGKGKKLAFKNNEVKRPLINASARVLWRSGDKRGRFAKVSKIKGSAIHKPEKAG